MDIKGIACQTITFGNNQSADFPGVFNAIATAGFSAVEIGFRHIQDIPVDALQQQLDDNKLQLIASHIGGNLEDKAQAAGEQSMIETDIEKLNRLNVTRLNYSGLRYESAEQLHSDLEMLNRSAEYCANAGVELLYHNHNWEFHNNWQVMNALLNDSSDQLGFCPDIGWVDKAGVDVIDLLEYLKPRLGAIHFKDFASREEGLDTVELGKGVVPLEETAQWLTQNAKRPLWIIAEQDKSELAPADAVKQNAAFLQNAFDSR